MIVFGYDGSEDARRAITATSALMSGPALVAHVWEPVPAGAAPAVAAPGVAGAGLPTLADAEREIEAEARALVEDGARRAAAAGFEAEPVLIRGAGGGAWRDLVEMAEARGGTVLVVGGSDASDYRGRHASAELYDVERRRFVRVGPLRRERYKLPDAVAVLGTGAVLVAGGARELELYDPRRRAFRTVGHLPAELAFSTATRLTDGRVLVAGGYDDRIAVTKRAWLVSAG